MTRIKLGCRLPGDEPTLDQLASECRMTVADYTASLKTEIAQGKLRLADGLLCTVIFIDIDGFVTSLKASIPGPNWLGSPRKRQLALALANSTTSIKKLAVFIACLEVADDDGHLTDEDGCGSSGVMRCEAF